MEPASHFVQGEIYFERIAAAEKPAARPVALNELRTRAGHYFDRVAAGETVEVVRHGRVVARTVAAPDQPQGAA
jgi:prevent-host-death family protein